MRYDFYKKKQQEQKVYTLISSEYKDEDLRKRLDRLFMLRCPKYDIEINIAHCLSEYISGFHYDTEKHTSTKYDYLISIGGQNFKGNTIKNIKKNPMVESSPEEKRIERFTFSEKSLFELVLAYKLGRRFNYKNTIEAFGGGPLESFSAGELERINEHLTRYDQAFKKAFEDVIFEGQIIDAQNFLDGLIGEGRVVLADHLESAVDDMLKYRQKHFDKNENEWQDPVKLSKKIKKALTPSRSFGIKDISSLIEKRKITKEILGGNGRTR